MQQYDTQAIGGKAISSKNAKEIGTRQLPFDEGKDGEEF